MIIFKLHRYFFVLALVLAPQIGFALEDKVNEGTVISVMDSQLVLKDKDNIQHTHAIGSGAKVTLDGKDAKMTDLQQGDSVKLATDSAGKVTSITARRGTVKAAN